MELVMEENGLIFRRCTLNYSGITVLASVNYFHMVHSSHIYMDTHTYTQNLIYIYYIYTSTQMARFSLYYSLDFNVCLKIFT